MFSTTVEYERSRNALNFTQDSPSEMVVHSLLAHPSTPELYYVDIFESRVRDYVAATRP